MKVSSFLIVHKWARLHKFGGHGRNIFHAQNFKRPPVLNPGHAPMNALCCKVRKGKWPMQLPKHQDACLIFITFFMVERGCPNYWYGYNFTKWNFSSKVNRRNLMTFVLGYYIWGNFSGITLNFSYI